MRIIGIDPGLKGALAVWDGELLAIEDMPIVKAKSRGNDLNLPGLVDIFDILGHGADHAFIEQVSAMPGQGVSSTFKFGSVYGATRALVMANRIPMTLVHPSKWKPEFGLTKDKEVSRARALELFPRFSHLFSLKKHSDRAEAALIALYGRNMLMKGRAT